VFRFLKKGQQISTCRFIKAKQNNDQASKINCVLQQEERQDAMGLDKVPDVQDTSEARGFFLRRRRASIKNKRIKH
jgi:hypothetical protein